MVLYPHAESIDEDSDHDSSVEVFTFHNPLQFLPEVDPGLHGSISVLQQPTPPAVPSASSQIHSLEERSVDIF